MYFAKGAALTKMDKEKVESTFGEQRMYRGGRRFTREIVVTFTKKKKASRGKVCSNLKGAGLVIW